MTPGANFRVAEFAHPRSLDFAPQLRGHGLHAVTNAKDGDSEFEHGLRGPRRVAFGHRGRPAGKNDPARPELAYEILADIAGVKLAVDPRLPHASGNELGVLRAEIEYQDLVMHGSGSRYRAGNRGTQNRPLPTSQITPRGNWAIP